MVKDRDIDDLYNDQLEIVPSRLIELMLIKKQQLHDHLIIELLFFCQHQKLQLGK